MTKKLVNMVFESTPKRCSLREADRKKKIFGKKYNKVSEKIQRISVMVNFRDTDRVSLTQWTHLKSKMHAEGTTKGILWVFFPPSNPF